MDTFNLETEQNEFTNFIITEIENNNAFVDGKPMDCFSYEIDEMLYVNPICLEYLRYNFNNLVGIDDIDSDKADSIYLKVLEHFNL